MKLYNRSSVLTVSSLQSYASCPHRFYLENVENVQPRYTSAEARRGTIIHEVLNNLVIGWNWQNEVERVLSEAMDEDHSELEKLLGCIEERYGEPPVIFNGENECAEVVFFLDKTGVLTDRESDAAFAGTIDLLFTEDEGRTLVVRDYKTGRTFDPPYSEPLESSRQLRAYAYAALQMLVAKDATTVRLEMHHIRFPYGLRSATLSREEFDGVWGEIVSASDPMFRNVGKDYATRPTELCGWCSVRDHCRAWNRVLAANSEAVQPIPDSFRLQTHEQAAQFAEVVRLVKARLSHAEDAIREYVKREGPITLNGETLDFWPSTAPKVNVVEAVRVLLNAGVPNDDVLAAMKITKTELMGLCKGRTREAAQLRADLKTAITEEPTTRFGWRKQ